MKSLLTILPFLFSFFETGMSAYYYTSEDVPQAGAVLGLYPETAWLSSSLHSTQETTNTDFYKGTRY